MRNLPLKSKGRQLFMSLAYPISLVSYIQYTKHEHVLPLRRIELIASVRSQCVTSGFATPSLRGVALSRLPATQVYIRPRVRALSNHNHNAKEQARPLSMGMPLLLLRSEIAGANVTGDQQS